MNIKQLESRAETRTIELEDRYFKINESVNEWEYLLSQLGISEEDAENINAISITVNKLTIEEY